MRKVVNITSIAGTDGNAGQAGYSSGQGRSDRTDQNPRQGMGPLQCQRQCGRLRLIDTRLVQPLSPSGGGSADLAKCTGIILSSGRKMRCWNR